MRSLPLRVAINAELYPVSQIGGVATVLVGLVRALGELEGPEEYVLIGPWQDPNWLRAHVGPNQRIMAGPRPPRRPRGLGRVQSLINRVRGRSSPNPAQPKAYRVPASNGFYERLGCRVVHFPHQAFVTSELPAIYNPHDLQHLHFPEFFTHKALMWRAAYYPTGCRQAHTVVVESRWVKDDVVKRFHIDPDKVQVIPLAPPTQIYPEPSNDAAQRVSSTYGLQRPFALYPAATWPHKNHLRLLEALAIARNRHGVSVNLVCTGFQNSFWPEIERSVAELRLQNQVKFLGMIPPQDLRTLYRLAQFVVVPTVFEAASEPIYEAWHDGTPVACSWVTGLPEQAGDAALTFDPYSPDAIAAAVLQMATSADLRETLRQRGTRRLRAFSWERTAKAYRAAYRRAAGVALTEEDRWLLTWDWMRETSEERLPMRLAR